MKFKKSSVKREKQKKKNALLKLFVDFPRQFILDIINRNPDEFKDTGIHIFGGEQGSGKTSSASYYLAMLKKKYPLLNIASNCGFALENRKIRTWRDIINYENGIYGQIIFIDEIQNWFSSQESKDFPPELLEEITQQRKQRKSIVATSQVFTRMGKALREQVTLYYQPVTLFGCLTICLVWKFKVNEKGDIKHKALRRIFFYVQDDKTRSLYDTFFKITRQAKNGYLPSDQRPLQKDNIIVKSED